MDLKHGIIYTGTCGQDPMLLLFFFFFFFFKMLLPFKKKGGGGQHLKKKKKKKREQHRVLSPVISGCQTYCTLLILEIEHLGGEIWVFFSSNYSNIFC